MTIPCLPTAPSPPSEGTFAAARCEHVPAQFHTSEVGAHLCGSVAPRRIRVHVAAALRGVIRTAQLCRQFAAWSAHRSAQVAV
eukprot:350923-Chlamydomonas_euryale.AAC.2